MRALEVNRLWVGGWRHDVCPSTVDALTDHCCSLGRLLLLVVVHLWGQC